MNELSDLLQDDMRQRWIVDYATTAWTPVYEHVDPPGSNGSAHLLIGTPDAARRSLDDDSWDLRIGASTPGFVVEYSSDEKKVTFVPGVRDDDLNRFVNRQYFDGVFPATTALCEDFRFLHNLYFDTKTHSYLKVLDHGGTDIVARPTALGLEVKTKYLRQYLAAKGAAAVICFDFVHFSPLSLDEVPAENRDQTFLNSTTRYSLHVRESEFRRTGTFSRLLGKHIVWPPPRENCGLWPFDDDKERHYPRFIIGEGPDGVVEATCNPDELGNLFGKNPNAPQYLTPVHFKRSILEKYYNNPKLYSVSDGVVSCASLWTLRVDNHHSDRVVVFLGDLGEYLPEGERDHWRAANIPPEGGLSEVIARRAFHAEFAEATRAEHLFIQTYDEANDMWTTRFGWPLFLPLSSEDAHHRGTLRAPLTNDWPEFDAQLMSLTKLLIDSLNEKEIGQRAKSGPTDKGIKKLELFLEAEGFTGSAMHTDFLRSLQALRSSGAAHRKGSSFAKASKALSVDLSALDTSFERLLGRGLEFLRHVHSSIEATPPKKPTEG